MRNRSTLALWVAATMTATLPGAPARWGGDPYAAATAGNALRQASSAFAAGNNPSLLGVDAEAAFGIGFTTASFRWGGLGNVVVDSPAFRVEDGRLRRASVTPPEAPVTAMVLGLRVPIRSSARWLPPMGVGITASGPLSTLRQFRASSPYDFAGLRYGTTDAQFKANVGVSAAVAPRFFLGAGLDVFVTAAGNADVAVGGDEPIGRFAMDVGWNTAAVLGAFWNGEATSAALTYRQRIEPRLRQEFVGALALGGADVAALPLALEATLYGEPETFELEVGRRVGNFSFAAGLRWERWEGLATSALSVRARLPEGKVRRTGSANVRFRDTLSPAASVSYAATEAWNLSAGYRWSPTPMRDFSGPANVLDAGTHVVGVGVSHRLPGGDVLPCPIRWSVAVQRHWTERVSVTKARADAVGAPGYLLFGGGIGVHAGLELAL
jgi:hypothetical protein